MPFTRIAMRRGKPPEYRSAIVDQLYAAMREEFQVPVDDLFVVVSQHDDDELYYSRSYLSIERDDDLVIVQITTNNTRTAERKEAFFKRLAERLAESPGIAPRNVFINLVETAKENWSFGNGVAQYASAQTPAVESR